MGLRFLFIVLVDLNNVTQFITMSFCLSDINLKKLDFLKKKKKFCLNVELLVYINLIKIN